MGNNISVDISVSGGKKAGEALHDGYKEGIDDAFDWLMRKGEEKAKEQVLSADRVWRHTLENGFEREESRFQRATEKKGWIRNVAPHAKINEDGLKPGNSPPVQAIIPWVDDKLGPGLNTVPTYDYDPSNWDPALQELAAQYSAGQVLTSFAVKNKLENRGYPGIKFMETSEKYLEGTGPSVVKSKIEAEMKKHLRAVGE